jgi:hypothetical protein
MSYLWLAELSKAGKVLAEGSKIKKAMTQEIDILASQGASVFTGNEAIRNSSNWKEVEPTVSFKTLTRHVLLS